MLWILSVFFSEVYIFVWGKIVLIVFGLEEIIILIENCGK